MSAGVPSIVSDCGGNPLLISDGENGFVFPVRDSRALAESVQKLIEDRFLYEQMKENSVRIFEERFTGERFAANVEAVYEKMQEGDRNGK